MTLKYQTFDALFEALARSEFRSKFRLTGDDRVFAELRSPELLNQHAHEILKNRIGASHPKNDGKQTPYSPARNRMLLPKLLIQVARY